jgi:hypothetical protein
MQKKILFFLIIVSISVSGFSQYKKFDSTVTLGKAGYHVISSNKSSDKNPVTVKLIGFDNSTSSGDFNVTLPGRVRKIEIDDFNNDGFPDMVIYVFGGANGEMGNVVAVSSEENKSIKPIIFPDIRDDQKLSEGYKGYDEFYLLNGVLFRSFPVYKKDDAPGQPTGGKRVIQYGVVPGDGGILKFKIVRSFEEKKQ